MFADFLIHHRLRCRRFIRFVMAKAAIADNINENIFLEFAQIIGGQFGSKSQCLRIIAIDMQNW